MEEQMKAKEVSAQEKPLLHWHNVALLSHFNCFAVSQSRINAKDDPDVEDGSSKKKTRGGWRTMPYIIGNESCEKLAATGLLANMIVYLTTKYYMQKVTATNVVNIWSGTSSLATLPGAFVADSYLGKFRTIVIGCLAYLVGLSLLTLTALIPQFRPSHCSAIQQKLGKCEKASNGQWALLVLVFLFKCIGSAGIRPCSMAFGADQFQKEGEGKDEEEKSKLKKILESFFNWYYFSSCLAIIVALTVIIYIQTKVSWGLGYGISTLFMVISTVIFLLGSRIFIHDIPQGSPFTGFAQVVVASIRKWNLSLPPDTAKLYHGQGSSKPPLTDRFRFLDKAAIITEKDIQSDGSVSSRWRLSSTVQTEALKSIIATLPIFSVGILSSITKSQENTFSVLQALTMNRKLGSSSFEIPAASFSVFSLLIIITWLPFYDRLIVPAVRRMTKNGRGITVFQRMGIGLTITSTSMLVAGFVEIKRRNTARDHHLADDPTAVIPISAFWLIPQFCLGGLGEAFYTVGHLEFFYTQFPPSMRSTAIAVSSCTSAVGGYLSAIVVAVVHNNTGRNGKPDWLDNNLNLGYLYKFYWLLSAMETLNLLYFILCAHLFNFSESPAQDPPSESGVREMEFQQIQDKQIT